MGENRTGEVVSALECAIVPERAASGFVWMAANISAAPGE
jgi:hypothetical protein